MRATVHERGHMTSKPSLMTTMALALCAAGKAARALRGAGGRLTLRAGALACLAVLGLGAGTPGGAQDATELAKKTQNPVADLISIPLQSNFNFTAGPDDDLQYILNIQPVVPFGLTEGWNLITRTILPLIYPPVLARTPAGVVGDVFGIGDIQLSLFLSPADPGKLIWGLGPIIQLPTAVR